MPSEALPSIILWCLVLVAAVVLGLVLAVWVRRRVTERHQPASQGFSLEDLRQLHRQGLISAEELQRARSRLAGSLLPQQNQKPKEEKSP